MKQQEPWIKLLQNTTPPDPDSFLGCFALLRHLELQLLQLVYEAAIHPKFFTESLTQSVSRVSGVVLTKFKYASKISVFA